MVPQLWDHGCCSMSSWSDTNVSVMHCDTAALSYGPPTCIGPINLPIACNLKEQRKKKKRNKAIRTGTPAFVSFSVSVAMICDEAKSAHFLPPWPSNTATRSSVGQSRNSLRGENNQRRASPQCVCVRNIRNAVSGIELVAQETSPSARMLQSEMHTHIPA